MGSEAKTALDLAREMQGAVGRGLRLLQAHQPEDAEEHGLLVDEYLTRLRAIPADAPEQIAALKAELAKVTEERDAAYTRCNELRGKCQSEYHRGYETGAVIGCRGAGRDRT